MAENYIQKGVINISFIDENKAVGKLTEILAIYKGTPPAQAKQIRVAASLHDVGKLQIPEWILEKPDILTKDEFEIVKSHTVLGAKMLKHIEGELGVMARACCLYHHEWYDGNGYWGKHINDLPFYIAYTAISDVFTALVSERPYKQAWPPGEALEHIYSKAGTQFDPALVGVFLPLVKSDIRVHRLFREVMP